MYILSMVNEYIFQDHRLFYGSICNENGLICLSLLCVCVYVWRGASLSLLSALFDGLNSKRESRYTHQCRSVIKVFKWCTCISKHGEIHFSRGAFWQNKFCHFQIWKQMHGINEILKHRWVSEIKLAVATTGVRIQKCSKIVNGKI